MGTTTIVPAPVRAEIIVQATPAVAFEVFTARMGRWWNPSFSIGNSPQKDVSIEPKPGGHWFERGEDGSECDWGRVPCLGGAVAPPSAPTRAGAACCGAIKSALRPDDLILGAAATPPTPAGGGTRRRGKREAAYAAWGLRKMSLPAPAASAVGEAIRRTGATSAFSQLSPTKRLALLRYTYLSTPLIQETGMMWS